MHAMGGIIDVRQFRGLRRIMPITFLTFVVGALALAGFPLLSGFFSKDEIIHAAFAGHPVLGTMALATAVLTAFYTFRMVFMAFCGEPRVPADAHPHESGGWMLLPLILLAVGALLAGYAGVSVHAGGFAGLFEPRGLFHAFLAPVVTPFSDAADAQGEHGAGHAMMYLSAVLAILGIVAAYVLYVVRPAWPRMIREAFPEIHDLVSNKFYVDEAYDAVIVRPLWRVGGWLYAFDRFVIDGVLRLIVSVPQALGSTLRVLQNGAVQGYGVVMTGGLVLIVLIVWLMR